jgi:hypothetical protein
VAEEDSEHMELYNQSAAIKAAVEHERKVAGHPASTHQADSRHHHDHHGNGHGEATHHDDAHRDHQGKTDRRPAIVPPAA